MNQGTFERLDTFISTQLTNLEQPKYDEDKIDFPLQNILKNRNYEEEG